MTRKKLTKKEIEDLKHKEDLKFFSYILKGSKTIKTTGLSYNIKEMQKDRADSFMSKNYGQWRCLLEEQGGEIIIPGRGKTEVEALMGAVRHLEDMGKVVLKEAKEPKSINSVKEEKPKKVIKEIKKLKGIPFE